jgi:hypothetical protein
MSTLAMEGNTEQVRATILVTTNEVVQQSWISSWNYPKPTWISSHRRADNLSEAY